MISMNLVTSTSSGSHHRGPRTPQATRSSPPTAEETIMPVPKHLRLLIIVTLAWLIFWLAGLPDYYRQYSHRFMVLFDAAILPPLWLVVYFTAKKARKGRGLAVSLWLSFYITVPLFIYDLIYCGIYLGYGISFLWEYWYLTVYYILPWLIFPVTGLWVDRRGSLNLTSA